MSPEMVSGEGYGHATDMWSLGITILELCEGEPPNGRGSLHRILSRTISGPTPTLSNLLRWSPHLIDFLQRCLVKDESNRATCEELLFHPWIAEAVERIERVGYSSHLLSFIQMHLPSLMNHRIDATKSFKRNSRVVMIMAGQLDNQPSNIAEDERVTMEEEMDRKLKEESITEDKVSPQVTEKIYSEAEEQVRSLVTEVEIGERKVAERKSFLTSERKSEVSIIPVPGIVIKTRTSLGNKVFINLCTHPRIRVGCWTSFGECTELSTHEDEVGVSFDICCDENYLKDIETDDSNENRDKV